MKIKRFWFIPQVDVEFSWIEVESFILFSEQHYDLQCRELSQPGGVLHGMRNTFVARGKGATITYRLDGHTADLLAKTVESDPSMNYRIMRIFKRLNSEWRRINGERG